MPLAGVLYALLAYLTWGLAPIYWKALGHVDAAEILAHRFLWTVVATLVVLLVLRRLPELGAAWRNRRERWLLVVSGALIAVNWGIFIWAVNVDRIVDTSLGYYLNPLINVAIGFVLLGERLSRPQILAVGIAAAGVAALAIEQGGLPWISLALAFSFALYGVAHKWTDVRPIPGLALESMAIAPLGVVLLAAFTDAPPGAIASGDGWTRALLVGAGPVTALPLVAFASAARRLPLSTLGLFQYVAPSLSLVIAVLVYGEPFRAVQGFAFGCIWIALAIYSTDAVRASRAPR